MDIQFDTDNLWLLDQALSTELPGEYKMFVNPDDEAYYVKFDLNKGTEVEVTWDHPLALAYRRYLKMLRNSKKPKQSWQVVVTTTMRTRRKKSPATKRKTRKGR